MLILKILKNNRRSFIYIILLLILSLSFSSTLLYLVYQYEATIKAFSSFEWLLAFAVITLAMAFSLSSTTVIALLVGYFIGFQAFVWYGIAYLIASLIGYYVARLIDKGKFAESLKGTEATERYFNALKHDQLILIILGRISPIVPFSIMNVLLANANFRIKPFIVGTMIGMLPRTLVCFWVGMQFSQIKILMEEGLENNLLQVVVIGLIIISVVGIYIYFNRIMKRVGEKWKK